MKKHDHKKTKDIKSKLFCITMLLPFIYLFSYFLIFALNENSIPTDSTIANELSTAIVNLNNWAPFKWATEFSNPIRLTIYNLCEAFNINSGILVSLITYWITISIIYIIFDIIIEAVVYITHFFNKEQ